MSNKIKLNKNSWGAKIKKPLFVCDPEKHTGCKGKYRENWCGVQCKYTTHKEFSIDGEPIAISEIVGKLSFY